MSSLRRDLLERKLWLVVAVLVVAIVASPVLLPRKATTNVVVPPAPHASSGSVSAAASAVSAASVAASRQAAVATDVKLLAARLSRDPFSGGMPQLQSKPSFESGSGASPSASSTTTSATAVTPAPAGGGSGSSTTGSGSSTTGTGSSQPTSGSSATAPASSSTTPTTSTTTTAPTSSAPTSSTTPSSTEPAPSESVGPWTVYSLNVHVTTGRGSWERTDLARLTPLPSPSAPAAMYAGVLAGGREVVFDLAAGETPSGPGSCVPSHTQCAAILLRAGQTEELTAWHSYGERQVSLHVSAIGHTVTNSQQTALAAYERHSAAGLCELALADPVLYDGDKGTLTVAGALCRGQTGVVPFPGSQGAL